jgi:hypothetical protein
MNKDYLEEKIREIFDRIMYIPGIEYIIDELMVMDVNELWNKVKYETEYSGNGNHFCNFLRLYPIFSKGIGKRCENREIAKLIYYQFRPIVLKIKKEKKQSKWKQNIDYLF